MQVFPLLLKRCDVSQCEARCCAKGAYLLKGEADAILKLVEQTPELREVLPPNVIEPTSLTRSSIEITEKTSTYRWTYRDGTVSTRCVFADVRGLCELEKLARKQGAHPWTHKPSTCWMFPLGVQSAKLTVPIVIDKSIKIGLVPLAEHVPCGQHHHDGQPVDVTLADELAHLNSLDQLPVLGR